MPPTRSQSWSEDISEDVYKTCASVPDKLDYLFKVLMKSSVDQARTLTAIEDSIAKTETNKKAISSLQTQNEDLKRELLSVKQDALRKNIVIAGLPEIKNENLKDVVNNLSTHFKLNLQPSDIDNLYKIATKEKTSTIFVSFTTTTKKQELMDKLKTISITMEKLVLLPDTSNLRGKRVIIRNHMSPESLQLFRAAYILKREHGFKYVWDSFGTIKARKSTDSPVIKIQSIAEVEALKRKHKPVANAETHEKKQ